MRFNHAVILSIMSALFGCKTAYSVDTDLLKKWFEKPFSFLHWELTRQQDSFKLHPSSSNLGGGELHYQLEGKACVVSIPHRFHDKYTAPIGESIYNTSCQLALYNSHHRHSKSEDSSTMDWSYRQSGLHTSAIKAFQTFSKTITVVQIHGFSRSKRKTPSGKSSHIILSPSGGVDRRLVNLQLCLSALTGGVKLYPNEVSELGGTKNVVRRIIRTSDRFLHVELSHSIRKLLIDDSAKKELFSQCFNDYL